MGSVTRDTPCRFSVIVPLGAQRGQTEACLRGWTRDQTFPRDGYEVLAIGHPPSLHLAVYVDGAALPVRTDADRGIARVRRPSPGPARLAWACAPWRAPRDRRFLGLPVHRISWTG
jgi:hypothetical protein